MKQYDVSGMSCAACSARVEKAVSAVEGVESCAVNLLTNSMGVSGTASDAAIIRAVEAAGYSATIQGAKQKMTDSEFLSTRRRLLWSLGFLLVLMYLPMGHVQMFLAICVMVINRKFFVNGVRGVLHKSPNMDTLVALGATASFLYGYFESAAMILVLITVGKMLEAYSKGKTTNAIKALMKLSPKTVTILRGGQELVIPVEDLQKGELFLVRPGESIATDGIVTDGRSAVDESALTGESLPIDKVIGDKVTGATINRSGVLTCRAERVGEDTTLSQIIKMVSDAAATKAPIAKIADKVSGVFVPLVIGIAIVTAIVWSVLGESTGFALTRAVAVLVISCPCALGLATPVAIMVASGVGAKHGILFKTAESLEKMGKVKIAVLDKTGTITAGKPKVTDFVPMEGVTTQELLECACALEHGSEHPLGKAIMEYGMLQAISVPDSSEFEVLPGNGLTAKSEGHILYGGSATFISTKAEVDERMRERIAELSDEGKTPMLFMRDESLLGIIAVADTIKEDSAKAIRELEKMGISVVMLTGDNRRTANAIGKLAGVDEIIAEVLPDEKAQVIQRFRKKGMVAMVGDGINDAPALTSADVGIAIGAGADVAIDAAEVVLVNSRLSDVCAAVRLGRGALRTIYENLFWAFFYNVIGIPLAAGAFISIFGWQLSPMFGAAAMSLSSFCVVTNALRLNFIDIRRQKKGERKMTKKTMKIEGMMCGHCEARVKKTLEALAEVESAEVSHIDGTAIVTLNTEISGEELKRVVEAQDYTVLEIN